MSASQPVAAPLTTRRLLCYALPWLVVQIVTLPLVNFVPGYYASELGIPLLQVSLVLLVGRGLDIFTDPLIGLLSDRTRTRIGRRKPWIIAGLPILMLGAWLLFRPPDDAGAFYLLASVTVVYLGFTMIQITYAAWGAELSPDYQGRSRIAGWREGVGMVGTLTAISSPLIAQQFGGGLKEAMGAIAVAVLLLAPLLAAPALMFVPEPPPRLENKVRLGISRGVRLALGNRDFRIFAGGLFFVFIGIAPGGALSYILFKDAFGAPHLFAWAIMGGWLMTLLCLPFWLWLGGRIGKHLSMIGALAWITVFQLLTPVLLYASIDPVWMVVLSVFNGAGLGALLVLPYSMIADIIDADTIASGRERSGIFMALGAIILKGALMLGVALALAWPAMFGFDAALGPDNSFAARMQVAIGSSWLTVAFFLCAMPFFLRYPLTRERQEKLRAMIEEAG